MVQKSTRKNFNVPEELKKAEEALNAVLNELREGEHELFIDDRDFDAQDIIAIGSQFTAKKDYKDIVKALIYKQLRDAGFNKREAFKRSHPERCIRNTKYSHGRFEPSEERIKDPNGKDISQLSEASIQIKASRLENSPLYKTIFMIFENSLYITYAFDRIKVLDRALSKSLSDDVADREQVQFMKLFLEETRRTDDASKAVETVNIQINNNEVNVMENKLNVLSEKLEGMGATKIIEMLSNKDNQ
jgi:hypothetical protein